MEVFKKFSKLASINSKILLPTINNTIITFTFGDWALPYPKLLKKIGIAKSENCDRLELELSRK